MALPELQWFPFNVGGRPSAAVKAATEDASGAYAIRTRRTRGVVYVGESHVGRLWRTLNRHFQAPETFTAKGPKGGHNAFATDHPEDYEVGWKVTTRGKRAKKNGDQRAMDLQARWIAAFRAAGHRLKNRDDGLANKEATDDYRAHLAKQEAEAADEGAFGSLLNPGSTGALTALGLLTRLELESGGALVWSLRDAPLLAYDASGRHLWICYRDGRPVVRSSTPAELREYKRTHWGATPVGNVRDCGYAVPPFVSLGRSSVITYTTKKGGDARLVDWVHPWGEGASRKGFRAPTVAEHRCKGGCRASCAARGSIRLVGGTYRVTDRGIVG
ncbi:MAG: hypothetical protein JWL95_3238 [Gemmatimonadetes bacterium]|nr:hypothetical protein [Gemmatimonadota bacterium]